MKKKNPILAMVLLLITAFLPAKAQQNVQGFDFVKKVQTYEEYKLQSNDLKVILKQDKSAPVVMFMVTYMVGSRNEITGNTGSTHLLEHLMFKGTPNFNKESKNSYDNLIEGIGGIVNATTWFDRTNYYALVPSEYLERLVQVEADRMRNLLIKKEDKESEMTVVRNEFEIGENNPQEALDKMIWANAYVAFPYHHSTIGWRSDIENVSVEALKAFYDTYYWPDNATVTVIGDFDPAKTLEFIKKYYGSIPKSPKMIPQIYTEEPIQEGARRLIVKRTGTTGIVGVAHKTVSGTHKDTYSFILIENILTNGKSARLNKTLIEQGLASTVNSWYFPFRDAGLFPIYATLTPNTTHEKVEKTILEVYEEIKKNGFTEEELKRAKAQAKADFAYSMDGAFNIASNLNESIARGDWTFTPTYAEKIGQVTLQEINEVFKKYFVEDQSTTGWFIPLESKEGGVTGSIDDQEPKPHYYKDPKTQEAQIQLLLNGNQTQGIADKIKDRKVENIRVLSLKTEVNDIVTIRGSLLAGDFFSPQENSMVARLTGAMLDQGTTARDKFAIADQLANLGASITFTTGNNTLTYTIKCLKENLDAVLQVLAEELRKPAFKEDDFVVVKKKILTQLRQQMENTDIRASRWLTTNLFNRAHPNYTAPLEQLMQDLEKVTIADLKAFHAKYYGNNSMYLVAVGDIDDAILEKSLKTHFAGWGAGTTFPKYTKTEAATSNEKPIVISMPDKTNVSVRMAIATGLQMNDPDYLALETATSILGGKFTARLMSIVRDQEGLTYGIYSSLAGSILADGWWVLNANFSPSLLDKGLTSTRRELNRWINEGITQAELDAEKIYAAGSAKVDLANTNSLANVILMTAQRNAPLKSIDDSPQQINALTLEQVNNAIKKYIQPKKIWTVLAGSIDENLAPLQKK